jgi:hypothetical protein
MPVSINPGFLMPVPSFGYGVDHVYLINSGNTIVDEDVHFRNIETNGTMMAVAPVKLTATMKSVYRVP